jgi:hydrogenase maturation protease
MKKTLIIGFGNTLRGDDGAGVLAAELVSKHHPEADCMTVQELHPEIAEIMSEYGSVIFFDAALDTDDVQMTRLHPTYLREFENTHSYSPQALVNVCQALYESIPSRTYLVHIPAYNFSFSEVLSVETNKKTNESVEIVNEFLKRGDEIASSLEQRQD